MKQQDLLEAVKDVYLNTDVPIDNKDLYSQVASKLSLDKEQVNQIAEVGKSNQCRNLYHRKVRWVQQSLKHGHILQRVGKGTWEMIGTKKTQLRAIQEGKRVIALSTSLGICLWAKSDCVFNSVIDEPIHLILTSPPYPLKVQRAYGNVAIIEYIDFVCRALEPIIDKMANGASLALNVSNDIFEDKSPARSTYLERLIIALEDRMGLSKMDVLPWMSNKIPGPTYWASKHRIQLNTTYEPILWFCNNPIACFADNRRVLQPHTEKHKKLMESGGIKKSSVNGDGAYRKNVGGFGQVTEGKIPKNILQFSNYCHTGRAVSRYAKEMGLPTHGAKMPFSLASFLVQYLSRPGDLIVDPFGGTLTSGEAAEANGRRWVCTEMVWEYIRQSFVRFDRFDDVYINPEFCNAFKIAA